MSNFGEQSKKFRKNSYSKNIHDHFDEEKIKIVSFQNNHSDIVLDRRNYQVCTPNNLNYNNKLLHSPNYWHQVIIHHENEVNKPQILQALENITNSAIFIPVAYRNSSRTSSFLIINQPYALEFLFDHDLRFKISHKYYNLTVKLGVAYAEKRHIDPHHQVKFVINQLINSTDNEKLDLSIYNQSKEMYDIDFSLYNETNFDFFCKNIVDCLKTRDLRMLILNDCRIQHLSPLARFKNLPLLNYINLKNNEIFSFDEFEHLKCLKLEALSVAGNPITIDDPVSANEQLMMILPTLVHTDLIKRRKNEQQQMPESSSSFIEEVIRVCDLNERFKAEFPRRKSIKNYWSRVVIEHNVNFDGKKILHEMFQQFFDNDPFFPCYFKSGEKEDSFMLYMNFEPLNILVVNNLQMKMSENPNDEIKFRLHLKCENFSWNQVKWDDLIPKVVIKRITASKLNLKDLKNDPELENVIVDLSTNYNLRYILTLALNKSNQITEIDLSHNELTSIQGLDVLNQFNKLISLDLSYNNIHSLGEFPKDLKLCELNMEYNPVCDKFTIDSMQSASMYVRIFKKLCPNLQYIDGQKIDQSFKIVPFQNFLVTPNAYMAIDNFIDFFFKNFEDLEKRNYLASIYAQKSMLTVTTEGETKNFFNQVEIVDYYSLLPEIEHDYVTLTVDVPLFYSPALPQMIYIVISGVFRHTDEKEKLFAFTRSFILRKDQNGTGRAKGTLSNTFYFEIINEIFHFDILSDEKIKNKAFKKRQATISEIESAYTDDTMEKKFEENLLMLKDTIMMKPEWCRRFLEEANGDFSLALEYFLEFYKRNLLNNEDFCLS